MGKFCPFEYGKGLLAKNRHKGNVPIYGSNGINDWHNQSYVKTPGIIVGRKGTAGSVHISKIPFWPIDTTFYIKDEPEKRNLLFTYYLLKNSALKNLVSDSAVPGLNREAAHALELFVPPLEEQKRIAEVLGAFDDKIELLQKQNKTLEDMAKALFKCWFVDFSVVRAKATLSSPTVISSPCAGEVAAKPMGGVEQAENSANNSPLPACGVLSPQGGQSTAQGLVSVSAGGTERTAWTKERIMREYHLTEELYNLFPSSFVDSPLGPIPSGWEVKSLGTICQLALGGTPSRTNPKYWENGSIPWINSGKVNDFRIITPSEYITEAGYNSSATKLLPIHTTVVAITGATLGQVSFTEIECCANQSVVGILENEKLASEYIYLFILFNLDKLLAKQTGGAQQHINKNDIASLICLVPSEKILEQYKQKQKPLFDKIHNNMVQIELLTEIRDNLLPRLISGKIRV